MRYIYFQPVGEVGEELLRYLGTQIEGVYGYPCRIAFPASQSEVAYSKDRRQYNAAVILGGIGRKMPVDAKRLLNVVDVDLFVPGMNFVFGLAMGRGAVISLTRLRPEYYGEKKNESLFRERALKEAIHELGHTFGLNHCPDTRCIMHFSNTLEDTDIKGPGFCRNCSTRIWRK